MSLKKNDANVSALNENMGTTEIPVQKKKLIKKKALSTVVRLERNASGLIKMSKYNKEEGTSW